MVWMWTLALAGCATEAPEGSVGDGPAVHFFASSEDGRRVAVALDGDALWVLEVGADTPLARTAQDDLDGYGVDERNHLVPVAGAWPTQPASDGIIQGVVDLFPTPVAFAVEPSVDAQCAGMRWRVRSGVEVASSVPRRCVQDVRLRSVLRGPDALWFVGEQDTYDGPKLAVAGVALR